MADWKCLTCNAFEIWGIDAPGYEESSSVMIAAHEATHADHLVEHDGDTDALRLRLQNPSLYAALNAAG
ncbi:hypothetical protein ACFXG4_27080 [Nocardia sp. NPDC059246]|uniref:hypothetical protein n=1 Tax=unclassified Nocardia TaxID=2637762 RepID=UPI0036C5AF90